MSKPKRRKVLANGRNASERFVALPHYLLRSQAWLTLAPAAKALLIQVWSRHNGMNNGEIAFSVREAADIGLTKSVAARAFRELVERGFLSVGRESTFNLKTKEARTWRLTAEQTTTEAATRDFMRWSVDGDGGKNKTQSPPAGQTVPPAGP